MCNQHLRLRVLAALLAAFVSVSIFAQTPPAAPQGGKTMPRNDQTQPKPQVESTIDPAGLNLTEGEKKLAEGSRNAILRAGISAAYFDKHFRLVHVFDKMGDRRVVWQFQINEYEATVNDAIGFYTDGGKRVDVNSVGSVLASAHDITRTIPRKTAERIMRRCIGSFSNPVVEYRALSTAGEAALLLIGQSAIPPKVVRSRVERERLEREERERRERREERKRQREQGAIVVSEDEGEEERGNIILGAVNLETGKCIKGPGIAGGGI
jgi:hypothetical protein